MSKDVDKFLNDIGLPQPDDHGGGHDYIMKNGKKICKDCGHVEGEPENDKVKEIDSDIFSLHCDANGHNFTIFTDPDTLIMYCTKCGRIRNLGGDNDEED